MSIVRTVCDRLEAVLDADVTETAAHEWLHGAVAWLLMPDDYERPLNIGDVFHALDGPADRPDQPWFDRPLGEKPDLTAPIIADTQASMGGVEEDDAEVAAEVAADPLVDTRPTPLGEPLPPLTMLPEAPPDPITASPVDPAAGFAEAMAAMQEKLLAEMRGLVAQQIATVAPKRVAAVEPAGVLPNGWLPSQPFSGSFDPTRHDAKVHGHYTNYGGQRYQKALTAAQMKHPGGGLEAARYQYRDWPDVIRGYLVPRGTPVSNANDGPIHIAQMPGGMEFHVVSDSDTRHAILQITLPLDSGLTMGDIAYEQREKRLRATRASIQAANARGIDPDELAAGAIADA